MDGTHSLDARRPARAVALLTTLALAAAACSPTASTSPSQSAATSAPSTGASEAPSASTGGEPSGTAAAGEPVEVEWFIGLGTGENEEQIPIEEMGRELVRLLLDHAARPDAVPRQVILSTRLVTRRASEGVRRDDA